MSEYAIDEETGEAARIAEQNDRFRRAMLRGGSGLPGRTVTTRGVSALGPDFVLAATLAVAAFDSFDEDNDPHGERDFGAFVVAGEKLFWKLDLYDNDLRYGSEDRADPAKTTRVLTIMLRDEY